VTSLDGGQNHTLALKNGTAYAWGHDGLGQLGIGTSGTGTDSDVPVQVQGMGGSGFLTGVSCVAGGGLHSLALKSDGTVYAWGDTTARAGWATAVAPIRTHRCK
jgi:alpha-tubulin suppressor-like RCC1 family protein